MSFESAVENSVQYLKSNEAFKQLEASSYWPKWHAPWWHMLLLHEMGETSRIPEEIVAQFIRSTDSIALKIFPIDPGEMPEGVDPFVGTPCHCQLGHVYQVLAARGVDVDAELPWIRPWFLKYQMDDGGYNCDNEAYLVKDEVPSSMVGTIPIFEAVLLYTNRPWTPAEEKLIQKGADFLMSRQLVKGSQTKHNASEQISAKEDWFKLCFPRYYLYDILRGLHTLLLWSHKTKKQIPTEAVREAITNLNKRFPDGQVVMERHAYEFAGSRKMNEQGVWQRVDPDFFPLLSENSQLGRVSPFLTKQWKDCQRMIEGDPVLGSLLRQ